MKDELILIGGGGHCKSVIDVIEDYNQYRIGGIVDIPDKVGENVLGYPVIGSDVDLNELMKQYRFFHITIGHILSNSVRANLFDRLNLQRIQLPVITAKDAYVSRHATIGAGCFVGHKAIINAGVVIGENTIINTGALIEHDSSIGSHCHISTMSTVNADCTIGDHSFLSSHAVINRGCVLGERTTVYSGAIVTKSFSESGIHLKGIPARMVL